MGPHNNHIFEFADFRLIPGEGLLLRDGEPVPLSLKAFSTLLLLVERHGHLVQKSELIEAVWDNAFVEEAVVSRSIWSVRHALGDTSKEAYIQTIPRRGYRFVAPVRVVTDCSGSFRLPDLPGTGRGPVTGAEKPATNGSAGEISIEPQLADEPNGFRQKNAKISKYDPRPIPRWGAYLCIGVVITVAAALFGATNWRDLGNGSNPSDRGTKNEEAYRLYRQAENLSQLRKPGNISKALDYLNEALTLDPNFAHAWASKALVHRSLATHPGADQAEQYRKSMEAVGKAREIDPNLSEAYSALSANQLHYEFDFAGAEISCKRAMELDPNSTIGLKEYADFLVTRGRFNEAIAELKRGIDLERLPIELQQKYALTLYFARKYGEEEVQWIRLAESNPDHSRFIYTRLSMNQAQQEKYDKAFEYLIRKLTSEDKPDNEAIERFRSAFAASGWRGVTTERIKHPELESFTGPFDVACLYATVGDKDKAFGYLEKAYNERHYRIAMLQVEPQLDPLRDDPRFDDLIKRVEGK